jgi:hypothetical protein
MAARRAAWRSLALFILAGGAMTNTLMLAHDPQLPPGLDPARRLSEAVLYTPEFVPEWPLPNLQAIERTLRGEHQPNWGTALGLRGAWSLAPLAAIWAIGFAAIGAVGGGSNRQGGDFDEKREPGKGEER